MPELTLHVWSDIACPWCYIGKRRLEAALAAFPRRAEVKVVTRSFELDIHAPRVRLPEMPYAQRLAAKYRCPIEQAVSQRRVQTRLQTCEKGLLR